MSDHILYQTGFQDAMIQGQDYGNRTVLPISQEGIITFKGVLRDVVNDRVSKLTENPEKGGAAARFP